MVRYAKRQELLEEGRDFVPKKARSPKRSPVPKKMILDKLVIDYKDNIFGAMSKYFSDLYSEGFKFSKKPMIIYDFHQTTMTPDGEINEDVFESMKFFLSKNYNIMILCYDPKIPRIARSDSFLIKHPVFQKIPRVYMRLRRKERVCLSVYDLIRFDKRFSLNVVLVDDNFSNIEDVDRLKNDKILGYYYTKYRDTDDDFKSTKELMKLFGG